MSDLSAPAALYPIVLSNLAQQKVVVIGGGRVATRKIGGLLEAGARPHLISPTATAELRAWAESGQLTWLARPYVPGDLAGASLVFAATDSRIVNGQVTAEAHQRRILCNVADVATEGDFYTAATLRHQELVISVNTTTRNPRKAGQVRGEIQEWLNGREGGAREEFQREGAKGQRCEGVEGQGTVLTVVPSGQPVGKAYLVGAGPGHPELITVRGLRLIQQADVVLYDRLIAPELLDEARPTAEKIYVGKEVGRQALPQEAINTLLVARVWAGQQVVRLKGGDPFVFGRGGEEALALAEAGLPFEIVPGITSAVAAPAWAGIPVTHRGLSTGFAVITGHEDPHKPERMNDWLQLAHVPTLVILMALANLPLIAEQLIEAGRVGTTPVAVISKGTTPDQRVLVATLETLAPALAAAEMPSPGLAVVGEVVSLRRQLQW
jgi:uroporphyrin-III C-methyltransferase / precorrin-2 dehydrogenase / sirohydrochlorin ferrochelatase